MTVIHHCGICKSKISKTDQLIAHLSCGHVFHASCLIEDENCDVCPTCHKEYTSHPMNIRFRAPIPYGQEDKEGLAHFINDIQLHIDQSEITRTNRKLTKFFFPEYNLCEFGHGWLGPRYY